MPFMHVHDHCPEQHDNHCHEQHDSEPTHTDERCPACVFLNTHIVFNVQPPNIITHTTCNEAPPLARVIAKAYNPITNIQSRAPPIFSIYT